MRAGFISIEGVVFRRRTHMNATATIIVIDPEFRDLIPPLTPDERQGLESDILREGCLDRLKVWRTEEGDVLIDGFNRKEICEKLGFPYETETIPELETREDVKRWIIRHQFHRRNLNEAQRSMLADVLANMTPGDNQYSVSNEPGEVAHICATSQKDVAAMFNVSRRSVQHARKVHENGIPELIEIVTAGKIAITAAADVASLPASVQRSIVASGPEAIREISKEMRSNRRSTPEESDPSADECPQPPTQSDKESATVSLGADNAKANPLPCINHDDNAVAQADIPVEQPTPTLPVQPAAKALQMSANGLYPCAHCGSDAEAKQDFDIFNGVQYSVVCQGKGCNMRTPLLKDQDATIAIWNHRV